jgi:hypothetical protein
MFTGIRLQVVSYFLVLAILTLFNCASAPLGHLPSGEFFGPRWSLGFWAEQNLVPIRGLMTVEPVQDRNPNFLRGAKHQLTLLGAAILVLLFFAWTINAG